MSREILKQHQRLRHGVTKAPRFLLKCRHHGNHNRAATHESIFYQNVPAILLQHATNDTNHHRKDNHMDMAETLAQIRA